MGLKKEVMVLPWGDLEFFLFFAGLKAALALRIRLALCSSVSAESVSSASSLLLFLLGLGLRLGAAFRGFAA